MLVAVLADSTQDTSLARAVLSWYQFDRGREVPAASKLGNVADFRCEKACRNGSDTGNRQ
ncbi:hypothetical protein GCM10011400_10450 [Paraburkholderia caffeinilytica]|uniref:Uncharacterized protein n=1 Tax=Paraburkholderia caffeinilytica TaxID=1761016 RepID=A0ABQ1LRI2_9BURK|nr:hypothetical protein GCM10011400_10450 [Paraburkholderia caffeinilytica]